MTTAVAASSRGRTRTCDPLINSQVEAGFGARSVGRKLLLHQQVTGSSPVEGAPAPLAPSHDPSHDTAWPKVLEIAHLLDPALSLSSVQTARRVLLGLEARGFALVWMGVPDAVR